jgi:hypothetical protein
MRKQTSIRWMALPIVLLLAVLLVGMTVGSVWHHHDSSASEASCPICHLSHQPVNLSIAPDSTPAFALVAPTPEPRKASFAPKPVFRRVPARAPPIA